MSKARLTGKQAGAAVVAGIFGHLLFAIGWIALSIVLLGGLITGILGTTVSSIAALFKSEGINGVFDNAGGVLGNVLIGLVIAAVVLIVISALVSRAILKRGTVRKPGATTWTAILIAAIVDLPLVAVHILIASNTDGIPFLLIALGGTVVVGILVWLWMTAAHRGSGSVFANTTVTSAPVAEKPVEPKKD